MKIIYNDVDGEHIFELPTKETVYIPSKEDYGIYYLSNFLGYPNGYSNVGNLQEQEGYFFTPEQLNEYTANVIRKALETAAEKSLLSIDGILEKSNEQRYIVEEGNHYRETEIDISKESITNTFEETFKLFKIPSN